MCSMHDGVELATVERATVERAHMVRMPMEPWSEHRHKIERVAERGVNDADGRASGGRASCSRASGSRASGGRGYVELSTEQTARARELV